MPAAPPGTVTQTWRDPQGNTVIEVIYHFDPVTGTFNANPAIDFTNSSGKGQLILVYLPGNPIPKQVTMPTGTGSVTRAQVSTFTGGTVTSFYAGGWTLDPANL